MLTFPSPFVRMCRMLVRIGTDACPWSRGSALASPARRARGDVLQIHAGGRFAARGELGGQACWQLRWPADWPRGTSLIGPASTMFSQPGAGEGDAWQRLGNAELPWQARAKASGVDPPPAPKRNARGLVEAASRVARALSPGPVRERRSSLVSRQASSQALSRAHRVDPARGPDEAS